MIKSTSINDTTLDLGDNFTNLGFSLINKI